MIEKIPRGDVLLDIKWAPDGRHDAFAKALPNRRILDLADGRDQDFSNVRYSVVWKPEQGLLASLPKLEAIFSLGAGVDHVFADPDLPDVPLVRFVDEDLTGRMVEWVTLQVLMHMRQQRVYDGQQRRRVWHEIPQCRAQDVRLGIMGFGKLGQACATVLGALGFQLNAWARSEKHVSGVTCFAGPEGLDGFLNATDILVSLLPYTAETHGIINKGLIGKLAKDGALGAPVLINAGRGGSQVEADIIQALNDGQLLGASLDVFETEPLPDTSPLWGMDNVIVTPHVAAVSDPYALAAHVAEQIRRFEAGEALQHVVARDQGY